MITPNADGNYTIIAPIYTVWTPERVLKAAHKVVASLNYNNLDAIPYPTGIEEALTILEHSGTVTFKDKEYKI